MTFEKRVFRNYLNRLRNRDFLQRRTSCKHAIRNGRHLRDADRLQTSALAESFCFYGFQVFRVRNTLQRKAFAKALLRDGSDRIRKRNLTKAPAPKAHSFRKRLNAIRNLKLRYRCVCKTRCTQLSNSRRELQRFQARALVKAADRNGFQLGRQRHMLQRLASGELADIGAVDRQLNLAKR